MKNRRGQIQNKKYLKIFEIKIICLIFIEFIELFVNFNFNYILVIF